MAKDILSLIKQKNNKKSAKKRRLIECKEDIQRCLDAGCTMKEIWETLVEVGRIDYSYFGFIDAVNKFILGTATNAAKPPLTPKKKVPMDTGSTLQTDKSSSPFQAVRKAPAMVIPVEDESEDEAGNDEDEAGKLAVLAKLRASRPMTDDEKREFVLTGKRPN